MKQNYCPVSKFCFLLILVFIILGNITRQASNSEVHLHTPTSRRDAVQQKVPFSLIRCSSSKAKGAFCSCVAWGWRIYNIVESESDPLTFSKKNPSRANGRCTYIHPPSLAKIRQRTSEEIGNKHTHKQTNAARIIVWLFLFQWRLIKSYIYTHELQHNGDSTSNTLH